MYREPGVYLEVKNNPRGAIATGTSMIPLIIGSGAKLLKKTISIVRASSGQDDTLPFESVQSIDHIGYSSVGASDWIETTDPLNPDDFSFVAGTNIITWETGKGPVAGETYYITLVHDVESSQYDLTFISSVDEVVDKYGPDIQENEVGAPVCPVSLGAQLVLAQGAPSVYVLQVEVSGAEVSSTDYQSALDNHAKFEDAIWRIIPMDESAEIQGVVIGHVNFMSTIEERGERSAFFGKAYTLTDTAPTVFTGTGGVLDKIGSLASSIVNKRISVIYPDVVSRTLSDGVERELGAPYLAAALAGAASIQSPQQSMTRMGVLGFNKLSGVKMVRSQKNLLAQEGVMIVEQATEGAAVIVRHQLTTDMSSTQSRENSILQIQDYASKYFRSILDPYIGKYEVTPELINMIKSTIKAGLNELKKKGIIVTGRIDDVFQDENNPDTVIVSLAVLPPYPCNYIDITLVLE